MDTHTPLRKRAGWPGCAEWGTGVGGPAAEKVGHRGPPGLGQQWPAHVWVRPREAREGSSCPHAGTGGAVSPPELAERTQGTGALGESQERPRLWRGLRS